MLHSRYRRILMYFFRVLLSLAIWELVLPRIGLGKITRRNRSRRLRDYGSGFRKMSVSMGGVLIKVGQFLSTRVDVLPVEITGELSELQDEVPPEIFENIREVAEAEFNLPLETKYYTFDEEPIAAASLGQAHHATLLSSMIETQNHFSSIESPNHEDDSHIISDSLEDDELIDVVVKIQRKNIELLIATDLAALRTVGKWLQRYPPLKKRMNITALLEEFTRTLYEEIDYLAEGRNAEIFSGNFKNDPNILVPKVIWSHTSRRVLTLEDVRGIKINDYDEITASGINRDEVASRLLNTYLKQIFEDGFFHADPHPGNLFVSPCSDGGDGQICDFPDWRLTFIDFGMVGRLPPRVFEGMRELLIAVGTRDAGGVVKASQKLGFLLPGADVKLLEKAEANLFDRFWGKNMMELTQIDPSEMLDFAKEFRQLLFILPFQIPQDIIYLGRALGLLSGMCTGLNPGFNVWDHIVPYAKKLISEEILNPEKWIDSIGIYIKRLIGLPVRIESIIDKIEQGEISVREVELADRVRRMEITIRQLTASIIFFAFFLSGILFFTQGYSELSMILLILSVVIFFTLSFVRTR
jgi:predicted unusual protein kinase regulating ubiquinone biosynthesis (AarF/ABC1/UbiB family)